jgi:long-chain acyl-CoA synthetase
MTTLSEMFFSVARRHAERPAVVEAGVAISYAGLEERVVALAASLHAQGVRRDDRVALVLPNGVAFVVAYFASAALGAVVVPLNESYQETELLRFLRECRVSCVVTAHEHEPRCRALLPALGPGSTVLVLDAAGVDGRRPRAPRPPLEGALGADAPAMCQFSSGSTGRPKRIVRTHAQLLAELESLAGSLGFSPTDRFLGVAPFSHVNGLMRTMMASVHAGATLYPLPRFERQAVVGLIEDARLSVFIAVPFVFAMLARAQFRRRPDLSSLRVCVSASAPFPAALNLAFRDRFGFHVRQLYGSTETGSISVNLLPDVSETLESVGRPLPGVAVEVCRADGRPTPDGEVGEIAVKSRFAITAYEGPADGTGQPFRDGFFLTRDLGRRDASGLLYLLGRTSLLINRGGYKVNPREIEEVLESHPKVDEAVALGVPTPYGDERIRAVIVANAACTEEELVEYCRSRIAPFKVPSVIEIRDSLPRSAAGKIRREALREGLDP